MSLILTSRPIITDTPRNNPAPPINPSLQETLTRIGGTVPPEGGIYSGMPVYRLAFGQQERHFCRGRMRVRFPDSAFAPLVVQERFFVERQVFARASEWIKTRATEKFNKFLEFDYSIFSANESLSSYLKQNESSLDYIQLADETGTAEDLTMDVAGIAASTAPKDFIYLCDVKEIIEIGRNCWYVMRWIPASSHGGRKQWQDMRYTTNAYVPELNAVVPIIDDLGAFPEFGFWIPRLEIAEYLPDERGNMSSYNYKYLEPCEATCIEPVMEMLREREELTNQDKDRAWRGKRTEEHLFKQRDVKIAAQHQKISKLLGVDEISA